MIFQKKLLIFSLFLHSWSVLLDGAQASESPMFDRSSCDLQNSAASNGLSSTPAPSTPVPSTPVDHADEYEFTDEEMRMSINMRPIGQIDFSLNHEDIRKLSQMSTATKAELEMCRVLCAILSKDRKYDSHQKRALFLESLNHIYGDCIAERYAEWSKKDQERHELFNMMVHCIDPQDLDYMVEHRIDPKTKTYSTLFTDTIFRLTQKINKCFYSERLKIEIAEEPLFRQAIEKSGLSYIPRACGIVSSLIAKEKEAILKQKQLTDDINQLPIEESKLRDRIIQQYGKETDKIIFPNQTWKDLQQDKERKLLEHEETQVRAQLLLKLHADQAIELLQIMYRQRAEELTTWKRRECASRKRIVKNLKEKHELRQEQERESLESEEQSARESEKLLLSDQFVMLHYQQKEERGMLAYIRSLQQLKNNEQQALQILRHNQRLKLENSEKVLRQKIEEDCSFVLAGFSLDKERSCRVAKNRQIAREQAEFAGLIQQAEELRLAQNNEEQQARAARIAASKYRHNPYADSVPFSVQGNRPYDPGVNVVVRKR